MKFVDAYYIMASTGDEKTFDKNFEQGFYLDRKIPEKIIEDWKKGINNPLSSEKYKFGNYTIMRVRAQIINETQMIIDGMVFEKDKIGVINWQ